MVLRAHDRHNCATQGYSLQPVKRDQIHFRQEASILKVGQGAQFALHDFSLLRYRLWNFRKLFVIGNSEDRVKLASFFPCTGCLL